MNNQFGILEEVNKVLSSFLTEQNLILEKLHNIKTKRDDITRSNNVCVPLNLETGQDFLKTKEAAFTRNKALRAVFEIPENLTWLDLSFNKLKRIEPEISQLRNLKILYLHGNLFSEFQFVLPELQNLENLYSLTLHGNPVEEDKNYRQKIISVLPRLKNLDFTNVTNSDLLSAELFHLSKNS